MCQERQEKKGRLQANLLPHQDQERAGLGRARYVQQPTYGRVASTSEARGQKRRQEARVSVQRSRSRGSCRLLVWIGTGARPEFYESYREHRDSREDPQKKAYSLVRCEAAIAIRERRKAMRKETALLAVGVEIEELKLLVQAVQL